MIRGGDRKKSSSEQKKKIKLEKDRSGRRRDMGHHVVTNGTNLWKSVKVNIEKEGK